MDFGPAHSFGNAVFKDVSELKPAHFLVFGKDGLSIKKYWELESKVHVDDFDTTCYNVKSLLFESIERQMPKDYSFCSFLSGGLDSSIITAVCNEYMGIHNTPLRAFCVDYVDNDKNFVKSDFQPNKDDYYINIMSKSLGLNHTKIIIDTPELVDALEDAVVARDMPAMADIDSSLLLFCKNVKKDINIALSGECADEIFRSGILGCLKMIV